MARVLQIGGKALVFAAILAVAGAHAGPRPESEPPTFSSYFQDSNSDQFHPDNWPKHLPGRNAQQHGEQKSRPAGLPPKMDLSTFDQKSERELRIKATNGVSAPSEAPNSSGRLQLGPYFVTPTTDTAIRTFRALNNSDCADDACAIETPPRIRRPRSSGTEAKHMPKPYFGLSIIAPLQ